MKAKVRTFNGTTSPEVTQRETDHRKLAREAAAEGFVLLENKDHFLPLAKGSKVGLYGAVAIRTIKGGTGSGDVNERDSVNIFQGMKNAGYDVTSSEWLEDYDKLYVQARLDWKNEIFTKLNGDDTKFFDAYSATPFFMPSGRKQQPTVQTPHSSFWHVSQERTKTVLIRRVTTSSPKKRKLFWHRFPDAIKTLFLLSTPAA